jgi:hypothetical protein
MPFYPGLTVECMTGLTEGKILVSCFYNAEQYADTTIDGLMSDVVDTLIDPRD